jgi:uncharacterized membrane protein YhaH (DUF805 family)
MNFGEAVVSYFKNYANVNGRASRNEYWFTVLLQALVIFGLLILPNFIPYGFDNLNLQILVIPWLLGTATPAVTVAIRRLHDVGLPTSAYFKSFIPFAGGTIVFFELIKPGQPYPNQWGNPVR